MKEVKKSSAKAKKSYAKPKLATHGDVRKLTQHAGGSKRSVGSGIFDHGWGDDHDHGLHKGHD
jgi:hypothetical protein